MDKTNREQSLAAVKSDCDRILTLAPNHLEALILRGDCLKRTGDAAGAFDSYFAAHPALPDDLRVWFGLRDTSASQFAPGRDPARVYQLLKNAKADFEGKGFAYEDGIRLGIVLECFPEARRLAEPEHLNYASYLKTLLRKDPDNARLLYHFHARNPTGESENIFRSIARNADLSKDAEFASLAAIEVAKIARVRGESKPDSEKPAHFKAAGEWLSVAMKLDPQSPFTKAEVDKLEEQVRWLNRRTASANAHVTEFNALAQRFERCRASMEAADLTASRLLGRVNALLARNPNRADWNNAISLREQAVQAKRDAFKGVPELRTELSSYLRRHSNAPQTMRNSIADALRYISQHDSELSDLEISLRNARENERDDYYDNDY